MKIRNNSEKVIGVSGMVLMPGDSGPVRPEVIEAPGVKVLIDKGYLAVEEEPKAKAPKAKKPEVVEKEESANSEVQEEKPQVEKPKRTRTTAKK